MRNAFLFLVLLPSICATAQPPAQAVPPEGSNWQHVQALPPGISIHVKARSSHAGCTLKSVDAETLTCTHGGDDVFQRSDILIIKISHRGRSMLLGAVIGAGVGAIIGAATANRGCSAQEQQSILGCIKFLSRGQVAALSGAGGAAIGVPVGYFTDLAQSTVYRAP